jgi:lysophospholipase L1-like esterase
MLRSFFKNFILFPLYLVVLFVVLAEVILQIYNPFAFRVKGQDIVLPAGLHYNIVMNDAKKLDAVIVHTKNSIGFRGPEKPADFDKKTTIIAIGGSTTECYYTSDSLVWTKLLAQKLSTQLPDVWVNNAGLNGHSTFGHQVLLDRYITQIKPKIVLFLVGINDLATQGTNNFDAQIDNNSQQSVTTWLQNHSELFNVFVNLKRYMRAKKMLGLAHNQVEEKLNADNYFKMDSSAMGQRLNIFKTSFVPDYRKRLLGLIKTCQKAGIKPVFVTQPLLNGPVIDPLTKIDLGRIKINTEPPQNGNLYWQSLELYNEALRDVCTANGLHCIDLAVKMPKNSAYYYDAMHFTNSGNALVASIIADELLPILQPKPAKK